MTDSPIAADRDGIRYLSSSASATGSGTPAGAEPAHEVAKTAPAASISWSAA